MDEQERTQKIAELHAKLCRVTTTDDLAATLLAFELVNIAAKQLITWLLTEPLGPEAPHQPDAPHKLLHGMLEGYRVGGKLVENLLRAIK